MKVGDRDDAPRRVPQGRVPAAATPPRARPTAEAGGGAEARRARPSPRGDDSRVTSGRRSREALDRDTAGVESNQAAARPVLGKQASVARRLTDSEGSPRFNLLRDDDDGGVRPSSGAADTAVAGQSGEATGAQTPQNYAPEAAGGESPFDFADDPLREEEDVELETPPAVSAGPLPLPDFSEIDPTSQDDNAIVGSPDGGMAKGTRATYEHDGVTYTQSTTAGGDVTTYYEVDGVNYSNTVKKDGSSTDFVSESNDSGIYTRTIENGPDGKPITDQTQGIHSATDPETGNYTSQSRTETKDAEGNIVISEQVQRPDGGRSNRTETRYADDRIEESYSYTGEQGTVARTTSTAANGNSETRTQRAYETTQPIESVGGPEPPSYLSDAVPLPEDGRSPTQVLEIEVSTKDSNGTVTPQHDETIYSQSSSEVEIPDEDWPRGAYPNGVTPSPDDTRVTRTVSVGRTRNAEGEWVEINDGSQTVDVVGTRDSDGSTVRTTVGQSWNAAGESSTTLDLEGFTRDEQSKSPFNNSWNDRGKVIGPHVVVGGQRIETRLPINNKHGDEHLRDKGGEEVENFLDVGYKEVLDTHVEVTRNAEGEITSEAILLHSLDDEGNGRTVSRLDAGEGVSWTYTDYSNDGQDYNRQTVYEGSNLSVLETYQTTGDGTFQNSSQTYNGGDDPIATNSASRQEVTESDLQAYVDSGTLTETQLEGILGSGAPYYVERADTWNQAIDGGDDNPDLPMRDSNSITVTGAEGYGVASQSETTYGGEGQDDVRTSFNTTTDPNGHPPVEGTLRKETKPDGSQGFTTTESADLNIKPNGDVVLDGDVVLKLGEGDSTIHPSDYAQYTGFVARALAGHEPSTGWDWRGRFDGELLEATGNLERLGKFTDIIGAVGGAHQIWEGIREGDLRGVATGGANVAGGIATVADWLDNGASSAATRFSQLSRLGKVGKVLGPAGAIANIGFGAWDAFTADSGYDRGAGGLTVAAGVASFFGPWGWAAAAGLGVAAYFVGAADKNNTAGLNDEWLDYRPSPATDEAGDGSGGGGGGGSTGW